MSERCQSRVVRSGIRFCHTRQRLYNHYQSPINAETAVPPPRLRLLGFSCLLTSLPLLHPLTMAFASSIAGPSRIPLQACASSCRRSALAASRSYATASDEGESSSSANAAASFYGTDRRGGRDKTRGVSFSVWKRTLGRELELPEKGQKAKWLGGNVVSVSSAAASSQ